MHVSRNRGGERSIASVRCRALETSTLTPRCTSRSARSTAATASSPKNASTVSSSSRSRSCPQGTGRSGAWNSTHYHIVLFDRFGRASDFVKDFKAVVARELNAIRGTGGTFFADGPGIQTVLGDEKVLEHCVYTLANAVAAGIVHKTAHGKGFNSLRMPYGKQYIISKPRIGIWSKKQQHKHRRSSQRSGRAAFADRSKTPETAVLMFDRPRILLELSDEQLRAKIREGLAKREAKIRAERKGKPVIGMTAARKVHWSRMPVKGEEMFGR